MSGIHIEKTAQTLANLIALVTDVVVYSEAEGVVSQMDGRSLSTTDVEDVVASRAGAHLNEYLMLQANKE